MNKIFYVLLILGVMILFSAGKIGAQVIEIENPITANSLEEIVDNLINFIFTISFVLAPLMIVWAGGIYMTSAGEPKKIETAKNIILYTLAGMAILLFSKGFVAIISQLLK
ncbi:MAG: hypothetical protein ABH876_01820 [Patescibacteria group bacterium]|nr:hypothetical protein [Patescibacteria group bacterium]MBU1877144.1 hypothetical protein [Patescibacteria group bacterium]